MPNESLTFLGSLKRVVGSRINDKIEPIGSCSLSVAMLNEPLERSGSVIMAMTTSGVGQVMIFVSSLEKAKCLYVDLLELQVVNDMSVEAGMLILKNEGAYLTLHEGYKPSRVSREDCRIVPIFRVHNIEEKRQKLKNHQVELYGEIQTTPVHRYQVLKDFDGNWIEIGEFK